MHKKKIIKRETILILCLTHSNYKFIKTGHKKQPLLPGKIHQLQSNVCLYMPSHTWLSEISGLIRALSQVLLQLS